MKFKAIASQLLNKAITDVSGFSKAEIKNIEKTLQISIPNVLKKFYLQVGNEKKLTCSFQRILPLNEVEAENNKLYFAEENQCVCAWAVDLETGVVYQNYNDGWYSEEVEIEAFLSIILFYNYAQGGADYGACGDAANPDVIKRLIGEQWQEVVMHNGLCIFAYQNNLVWWFYQEENKILENRFYLAFGNQSLFNQYVAEFQLTIL